MPDRSVPKKTPTSITPNTVVVLCAIAALIAILVFLESHIRRLSIHAASHRGVLLDPVSSATDIRQFRQARDAATQTRFVSVRFTSRKTLNQRSLLFRALT